MFVKVCDLPLYSALGEQGRFIVNSASRPYDTLSEGLTWSC
jgi:hypothetical protein